MNTQTKDHLLTAPHRNTQIKDHHFIPPTEPSHQPRRKQPSRILATLAKKGNDVTTKKGFITTKTSTRRIVTYVPKTKGPRRNTPRSRQHVH